MMLGGFQREAGKRLRVASSLLVALAAAAVAAAPVAPPSALEVVLSASTRAPAPMVPVDPATGKKVGNNLELSARLGPLTAITALCFSADGQTLYVGSYARVAVWDLRTGKVDRFLQGVEGAVDALKLSPDGARLAVGGGLPARSGVVLLYDGKHPTRPLARLKGHADVVYGLDFSPDSRRLATASFDKLVKVWDLQTGKEQFVIKRHSDQVYAVAFSPDGKLIASAGKDQSVKLFDAATGKGRRTLTGHSRPILSLAFSADGKQVLSAGEESQIRSWTVADGKNIRRANGHSGGINELTLSRDRQVMASVGSDKRVHLWNPAQGKQTKVLNGAGEELFAVALSPDGKRVAAGGFAGIVRLWDIASGRVLAAAFTAPAATPAPEYLTMTPEGYYTASPGVAAVAHWRIGGQPAPDAPLRKALLQPAEVARSLAGAKVSPVKITPPPVKE